MPVATQSRLGQTKQFNGHTYALEAVQGGAHRWVRQDKEEGGPGLVQQSAKPESPSPDVPEGIHAAAGGDHAARHDFTKKQLGTVQGPVRGVMAAMHAAPSIRNGGAYYTKSFAPEQAGAVHQWLSANVGKQAGGGKVQDLGNGYLGFSSPAGSLVVKQEGSKHTVYYTNQTGAVQDAMGGGKAQAGSSVQPPPVAPQPPPVPPPVQQKPAGENPFAAPKPEFAAGAEGKPMDATTAAAAGVLGEKPQAAPKPPKPAPPSNPRAAADEARQRLESATQQWREESDGGLTPKGNARWRSYVGALRSMWKQHESLAKDWENKSKGGGKGKSDTTQTGKPDDDLATMEAEIIDHDPAALTQIKEYTKRPEAYRDLVSQYFEALNPDAARKMKAAQKSKGGEAIAEKAELDRPLLNESGETKPQSAEQTAMSRLGIKSDKTPESGKLPKFKTFQDIDNFIAQSGHEGTRREALTKALGQGTANRLFARHSLTNDFLNESVQRASDPTTEQREFYKDRIGELESKQKEAQDYSPKVQQLRGALGDVESRIAALKAERSGMKNGGKSKKEIERKMRDDALAGPSTPAVEQPPESKLPAKQRKLAKLTDKYLSHFGVSNSEANKAAIQKAIAAGQIAHPKDLRTVLRTAAKLHQRGNTADDDHGSLKESIRRKASREKRESYQGLVKKQAAEWDMKPEEYHKLAQDIYPDFVKHSEDREAAKAHARKVTGLSAADINRLENNGFDSATGKRFDEIGRELAAEHPGIFGGEGYGDEADVDYGAKMWDLIREGEKRPPGKASKEFHEHLDDFLRAQLRGGSAGEGHTAEGDDMAMTPFSKIRRGAVVRYRKWIQSKNPIGELT